MVCIACMNVWENIFIMIKLHVIVFVPIMVHQHVDDIFEEVWLFGAEEASCDLVHGLF